MKVSSVLTINFNTDKSQTEYSHWFSLAGQVIRSNLNFEEFHKCIDHTNIPVDEFTTASPFNYYSRNIYGWVAQATREILIEGDNKN